jgi:hypothetical protein
VLSIFIGIIASLSLIIRELCNAPMGYESEDGFHFGEPIFPAYVISGHFDNTYLNSTAFPQDQRPLARMRFLYVFAGPSQV